MNLENLTESEEYLGVNSKFSIYNEDLREPYLKERK